MSLEDPIRDRILNLLNQSQQLSRGTRYDQCTDPEQMSLCSAWITSAQNVIHLVVSRDSSPYREKVDRIAQMDTDYTVHRRVREVAAVLRTLLDDVSAGLITSVEAQAAAATFDQFLDHAEEYFKSDRKSESGVIAGVVFEDTIRRIARKLSVHEAGEPLDKLISALASSGELSGVKAKRCRAAAGVRTKASHAQWEEFELTDVRATIDLTRELISSKLDE